LFNPEAESEAMKARSLELVELLEDLPVVKGSPPEVAESRRLAQVAGQVRRTVAARIQAGLDPGPGVVVGGRPAIRRVVVDNKGKDVDPLGGRVVISDELVEHWRYRRDVLAPAVAAQYTRAAEETPFSESLVAAAKGHLSVLRGRESMKQEGGVELEAAVKAYSDSYSALRTAALDAQQIGVEAENRLNALQRERAQAQLGEGDTTRGLIASAMVEATDALAFDPESLTPLVPIGAAPPASPITRGGPYGSPTKR
jgi:hypothetical protein